MKRNHSNVTAYQLEFHISRQARQHYDFSQSLFTTDGNVIFADFQAARLFAQKMNEKRDLAVYPERAVRAGEINAMGLMDEILHQLIEAYRIQQNPPAMELALEWVTDHLGRQAVDQVLLEFADQFPARDVYLGLMTSRDYFEGESLRSDGRRVSNRELLLEEMLMLWLANENPALQPYADLFDDAELELKTAYSKIFPELDAFFATQPKFGPDNLNLIDLLRAPAKAHPYSLFDQLEFVRSRWGGFVASIFLRLLTSMDMIREEQKPVFGVGGDAQAFVYEYHGPEYEIEPERFSQDEYWMPNLVLMAKNTYVWLDQLARKYKRPIQHLDQVPEEELALMGRWGFTGLWLIGLWERSQASQKIKQLRGNPDAVASAYSLFSYDIAADLGGEEAYQILRAKAWRHGIRLASDMVPNHMGIDSRWVIEHPNWFVQLDYSPFPTYSFNGPNLSWDERVGIFIEDHYFDNTDAAVVFKRVDNWTGEARYIYHGNDGTSMPWNDTAQLNYLLDEVREAVIQTILHVARKFPIIRFDAAMTLAKRHYQRLWYPEPGSGGDIPSRAEHGLTKPQFDQVFPEEFWRQVVDRVAQEAPDTLLLAEAFWLMEGYFVRTLGMHRVYNSAFMNMMRDEKNQEYRLVIKNTMEFDPEILKRFVNFMNNPDEKTAVEQFGKGDKYFGVCTVMATLPGLPMFGHGQIEGFAEKYGMEFRFPKWHEQVDGDLVARHEREIFPLLRKRFIFAESDRFRLYDFYNPDGFVNEDVYAYSNQAGDQRALVVFHNRYSGVSGWINMSAAYPVKTGSGDEKTLVQTTLAEALGIRDDPDAFTICRDLISGLEHIFSSRMIYQQGLYLTLNAYECHVFSDFREVWDDPTHNYSQLNSALNGAGVKSLDEALRELELQSLLTPYRELVNPGMLNWLTQNRIEAEGFEPLNHELAMAEAEQKIKALLAEIWQRVTEEPAGYAGDVLAEDLADEMMSDLKALLGISSLTKEIPVKSKSAHAAAVQYLLEGGGEQKGLSSGQAEVWAVFLSTLLTAKLGKAARADEYAQRSLDWMDDWLLGKVIATALEGLGLDAQSALRYVDLIQILIANAGWLQPEETAQKIASQIIASWLKDPSARRFLRVHPYEDVLWFNKEAFEELTWWTFALEVVWRKADLETKTSGGGKTLLRKNIQACYDVIKAIQEAEVQSGYQVEKLS